MADLEILLSYLDVIVETLFLTQCCIYHSLQYIFLRKFQHFIEFYEVRKPILKYTK